MNRLLYDKELKGLISERNKMKELLEATNIDYKKEALEKLLELKEQEISDKIDTIKYYSFMNAPVNKFIEKLFKHFIGGYDWKVDKNCNNEGNYWISFANYPYGDNPQEFFIRYINRNEYESLSSPECILTDFYKLNDNTEKDIDKLETTIEIPSYAEDFMNDVIMWRVDNQEIIIPEEKLEEIYNNILEKYSLDKENTLKRVK